MAQASLADVIDRIKAEGQLQRNSGTNSLKSIKDLLSNQNDIMSNGFDGLISAITSDALANKELKMENDRLNERLLQALQDLKNQGGGGDPSSPDLPPIGGLGIVLGGLLGGVIGILQGQFKAIQTFAKAFTPEVVKSWFSGIRNSILDVTNRFRTVVSERVAGLRAAMSSGFERLKSFFTFAEDSKIGKIIGTISARISMFAEKFRTAGGVISGILEGPLKALRSGFTFVKGLVSSFGNFVGRIAGVVGKIFAPIAIVLTLFETVKGAIDGYAEGGILGGLEGAITGFFNSLITKPLDLVKDAVAWVLEKFNWTEGADALNSFSFTDLFNNMIGGLFDFVGDAIEWVKLMFSDPAAALQQLWSGVYGEEGIFNTLIWKPLSQGINWIMEKFGWKEEGAPDFDLFTFVTGVWDTVVEKVKAGFESFGNFLASIPSKLKLFAYETIRGIPGGDWIIDDEALQQAQADVAAFETAPDAGASGSANGLEAASSELTQTQTEREAAAAEGAGGNAQVGVDASTNINQRSDTVYVETDLSARNGDGWANMDQDAYMRMVASGQYGG